MEVLLKCIYSKNSNCLKNKYVILYMDYITVCVFIWHRESIHLVAMEKLISLVGQRASYVLL